MDHQELESTAQAIFGFVPKWSRRTLDNIIEYCQRRNMHPAVYLRAFALNTEVRPPRWFVSDVILHPKYLEFVEDTLNLMVEEANVRYDTDSTSFTAAMTLEQDAEKVLGNDIVEMSAVGRVYFARIYKLNNVLERYMGKARKEALSNPFLADKYAFWAL